MKIFRKCNPRLARFPEQASGFVQRDGELFQVVVTPVYVQSERGSGLLDVLVAGYGVDASLARRLKDETGGSDFVFVTGRTSSHCHAASGDAAKIAPALLAHQTGPTDDYLSLATPLRDVRGAAHRPAVHSALV